MTWKQIYVQKKWIVYTTQEFNDKQCKKNNQSHTFSQKCHTSYLDIFI